MKQKIDYQKAEMCIYDPKVIVLHMRYQQQYDSSQEIQQWRKQKALSIYTKTGMGKILQNQESLCIRIYSVQSISILVALECE